MNLLVQLHSLWRWLVLIVAIAAIVKAFIGWLGRQPYAKLDRQLGMYYTMAIDIQVLIGLILYIVERRWLALSDMGNAAARFFAVEHPVVMLLALVAAHIGYSRSRRGDGPSAHRTAAVFYLISLALIVAAIPWDRVF